MYCRQIILFSFKFNISIFHFNLIKNCFLRFILIGILIFKDKVTQFCVLFIVEATSLPSPRFLDFKKFLF